MLNTVRKIVLILAKEQLYRWLKDRIDDSPLYEQLESLVKELEKYMEENNG